MSRSPSRSPIGDRRERRASDVSMTERDRPDGEAQPAKRQRVDTKGEDKARNKRMFGNILGTLQRFKKEDKTSRTSEAAKKREQVSERIANKLRSETTLHHQILESERELKSLRIATESAEFTIKYKDAAMTARHAALRPTSRFLHTSIPSQAPPIFEGGLLNPSPIPLAVGPKREPPHPHDLKPLYFLPKILLPHQEDTLRSRIANIDELINDEHADLVKEKENVKTTAQSNKARMAELSEKLGELRRQVKPAGGVRERDDFGRTPREQMDSHASPSAENGMEVDREREREESREATATATRDREAGVQIKGEDGDVEVEY